MMTPPSVSVVLPVFNAELYVREAVESILSQTFSHFEFIIINDGSTDGSTDILRELAAIDSRIILVERSNDGHLSALNLGIELAQSDLIARMDADDISMPDRFALQVARMRADPGLAVLGSSIRIIDKCGRFLRLVEYPKTQIETARILEQATPVAHPAVMLRRDAVLLAGGYRKPFLYCEDYDLWLRISELGFGIANMSQALLNYRWHGSNTSDIHYEIQELGALIAIVSHRMRKAGLPDPVVGDKQLSLEIFQSVPLNLRQDLDGALFALRYSRLSNEDKAGLVAFWKQYCFINPNVKREFVICRLMMCFLKGALRNRAYLIFIQAFAEALRLHPRRTLGFLWWKVKAVCLRCFMSLRC